MGFLITAEKNNVSGKYKGPSGKPLTRAEREFPVTPQKVTLKGEKQAEFVEVEQCWAVYKKREG